jgi:hypothetical protein
LQFDFGASGALFGIPSSIMATMPTYDHLPSVRGNVGAVGYVAGAAITFVGLYLQEQCSVLPGAARDDRAFASIGVYAKFLRNLGCKLMETERPYSLRITLHSAIQPVRNRLMPGVSRYPLPKLRQALSAYTKRLA